MKREFKAYIPKINPKQDFSGYSHNLFVGRFGYPNVNIGLLSTEEKNKDLDNPKIWSKKNLGIEKIMDYRMAILNSKFGVNIKTPTNQFYETTREIAQANNYADVDISLDKKPVLKIQGGNITPPYAASASLKRIDITNNPRIPIKVSKAINDSDWKATESIPALFQNKIDENYLVKLLSSGSLGVKNQRKLVPTRWSITAVDDTISKQLIEEIKQNTIEECHVYEGGYLGNYYIIIMLKQQWSYELYEINCDNGSVYHDYELSNGRKNYAQETVGGYYATRLAISETLKGKKIQAAPLVFRFITDEYYQSLGVWVVREAVRKTMNNSPKYMNKSEALSYAVNQSKKYNYYIKNLIMNSEILKYNQQKKIFEF